MIQESPGFDLAGAWGLKQLWFCSGSSGEATHRLSLEGLLEQMTMENRHTIEVWGAFACFTSAMKVERWTHPFITPSAARGIFDAIFVNRHEFRWLVEKIEILRPPEYIALMRNEVKEKGPTESEVLNQWVKDPTRIKPILADGDERATGSDTKGRTQRQTMALRDVRYRLTARIALWPNAPKAPIAYSEQFLRRLKRGQHFTQPVLGCREFTAFWSPEISADQPIPQDLDAGWMVYDVFDLSKEGDSSSPASVSVFRAVAKQGVLHVPPYDSPEVRRVQQ
jgi:CRISPR-associated protein Cas5d